MEDFRDSHVVLWLVQSTDGSNFPKEGGGEKNATELRHFLFSQICVHVKSSEACKLIRPTLISMVHDIGQISAKPHIKHSLIHSVCFFLR